MLNISVQYHYKMVRCPQNIISTPLDCSYHNYKNKHYCMEPGRNNFISSWKYRYLLNFSDICIYTVAVGMFERLRSTDTVWIQLHYTSLNMHNGKYLYSSNINWKFGLSKLEPGSNIYACRVLFLFFPSYTHSRVFLFSTRFERGVLLNL